MPEPINRPSTNDRERRRGSLARAFDNGRAAMKPPSSSVPSEQSPTPRHSIVRETAFKPIEPTSPSRTASVVQEATNDHAVLPRATAGATELAPAAIAARDRIEVDAAEEGDSEDPLLPLPLPSGRRSLTPEKARDLFAQHGLHYEARSKRPMQEPPMKIRRVEKPIRLRVHWTCHQCSQQFGLERICVECGHHRCSECSRHPPKVRDLGDSTRLAFEQESIQSRPLVTPEQHAEAHAGPAPPETPPPETRSPIQLTCPLELDDGDGADADADIRDFDFTMYARPREEVQTVMKPKARLGRRICHKCETDLQPSTRNECQSCGHLKCSRCPRLPQKSREHGKSAQHGEEQSEDDAEVPMVKAVQRVYRKPRQRVRYTCEHCDSLFIQRSRCQGCGHERCTNCHREPPKRPPTRHDPEILRAVADRLAAYGATLQQSPGVTVGGA